MAKAKNSSRSVTADTKPEELTQEPEKVEPKDNPHPDWPLPVPEHNSPVEDRNGRPCRFSPEWSDYVMTLFTEDELFDGKPKADGLRRVAQHLLGPILEAYPEIVQCPSGENGNRAVCSFNVTFQTGPDDDYPNRLSFGEIADVSPENADGDIAQRFALATASTRAEGRALRKALGLKGCSAEEVMAVPPVRTKIAENMKTAIASMCRKLKLDLMEFVNSGRNHYDSLDEITPEAGNLMLQELNRRQQREKSPEEITSG